MSYYVYFIHAGNHERSNMKIGVTTDLEVRMRSLQTGNPYKLKCKAMLPCVDKKEAYKLESFFHWKLKKNALQGEWFRCINFDLPDLLRQYISCYEKGKVSNSEAAKRFSPYTLRDVIKKNEELKERILELECDIDALNDELTENYINRY